MKICPIVFSLTCLFLFLSTFDAIADGSNPPKTFSITPHDADAKLLFTLTDGKSHNWIDLFTSSSTRAAVSQWQAISDTPIDQDDVERQSHLLMLLYWQSCFPNSSTRNMPAAEKAPHSEVDADELKKLHYAPIGLPTEVLSNTFNGDGHWYQAALQQILTEETDRQSHDDNEALKVIVENTGQARDVFTRLANSLDHQAELGGASATRLKAEAAVFHKLGSSVTLIKDQDKFKFKISATLAKRLPHSFLSGTGAKTVSLPLDKVLIFVQLATTFSQKMALGSEKAAQLSALLDYANANSISLNPDFATQSRILCETAGQIDLVLVATFLDTAVDCIKKTAITNSPSAMAALSKKLAVSLAEVAPQEAGYFASFASSVVDKFSLVFAADAGGNLLFNTSGTYGNIKTAEFCNFCAQQFDQINGVAHSQISSRSPVTNSLTTWAMSDYFHEVSLANYHKDYASLLQGGRAATWIANLLTLGGVDANIDYHNAASKAISNSVDKWIHPAAMNGLVKLYRPIGAVTVQGTVSPTVDPLLPIINYHLGFRNHGDLTTNGSGTFSTSHLDTTRTVAILTNGPQEAGSVFSSATVDIRHFTTEFIFVLSGADFLADGFTFAIQAQGPNSIGGAGGSLGYGDEQGSRNLPDGIRRSVAIKFDLYDDVGEGKNSTGLFANGVYPGAPSTDLTSTGIDLHSGDIFRVIIFYDGNILTVRLRDNKTGKSATQTYSVDIPAIIGANKAYVGFTGGTGVNYALQEVYSWNFASSFTLAPIVNP